MTYVGKDWAEKGANHIHQDCHQENPFSLKEKNIHENRHEKQHFSGDPWISVLAL